VVIENKPGAGGIIGSEAVKSAPADGYTLLLATNSTHAAAQALYKKLSYDPVADFEHIGLICTFGSVLLVPPNSPFKTLPELIAHARANPAKLFFGHFNTSSQIPGELLRAMGQLPVTGVPYKSITNALPDLMGGQIQFMFMDYVAAAAHMEGGKLLPLAVTEAKRAARWSDVPAVAETYPGYEVLAFLALAAPARTPRDIVLKLNGYVRGALAASPMREQMEKLACGTRPYNPDQYKAFFLQEKARWEKYVKAAGIEPQ
jgi:tripartite-type tricarboxylate transporter receptor subunit TctC